VWLSPSDQGLNPNTADNNDDLSKESGFAMFDAMGVRRGLVAHGSPGTAMEVAVAEDLARWRRDLEVGRSRAAGDFEQYAHLNVLGQFKQAHRPGAASVRRLSALAAGLPASPQVGAVRSEIDLVLDELEELEELEEQDLIAARLKADMPEESMLRIILTCGSPQPDGRPPLLAVAMSSKWTLRTNRAQDCISQGAKLADQRRGRMPHFGVVTMEPRPSMLRLLTDGSGAIDCVRHLLLPALQEAVDVVRSTREAGWSPGVTFDRLIAQRRLRDYDELVEEVVAVPAA
jgi:hypothetical protein